MTNVSFHGTGTAEPLADNVGFGKGLQIGLTEIDFGSGDVKLVDSSGLPKSIGRFVGLHGSDSEGGIVKTIIFKSKVACTIIIDKMTYTYDNVNQWVAYNHVNTARMQITRVASGQNPDVYDFDFQASDDPDYSFTIQNSNKDSELETVFPNAQRSNTGGDGAGNYTQTTNLRGAKKLNVILTTANIVGETGNVTISGEIFDPASQTWKTVIPATDLFGANTPKNQSLVQPIGDTISQNPASGDNSYVIEVNPGSPIISKTSSAGSPVGFQGMAALVPSMGFVLPSGDNVFRFKAVVAVGNLTFSLGIIKVFG